jgi:hypothetical protein
MIGFAVDVGAQSARAGIPEHIQEALARSGMTRHAAAERLVAVPPAPVDGEAAGPAATADPEPAPAAPAAVGGEA